MDPFMVSSTTTATAPVPTVEVGQGSGTPLLGTEDCRAHSGSNSRITGYDDLARFDPFDIDFIDDLPPLPDVPIDPTIDFSPEELSYLNSQPSMPVGSLGGHIEGLSKDSDLLGYIADGGDFSGAANNLGRNDAVPVNPVVPQAQGIFIDGSTNVSIDAEQSVVNEVVKKAMPHEKLAELAVVDPKRAKRILANRESAARSKERRTHYTMELDKKVHILQAQSAEISVKLEKIQKENSGMNAQKKEIVCDTQCMDEKAKIREELNDALRNTLRKLEKEYKQKVPYKHRNYNKIVSQFSSHLALYQVAVLRSWQAQQQPGMQPSQSDQPENAQSDSEYSSSNSEN